jgi:UDP-N-acetylmuramate dehydrogenase
MVDHISAALTLLQNKFGDAARQNVPLASYVTARIGGPADLLVEVRSAAELEHTALLLWEHEIPFILLGSGSNVLISDQGVRGAVIINRAKAVRFDEESSTPTLWAESGANLGSVARQAAIRGFSGLEWAATVPGTVGGAVYGNAGAHDGDMSGSLVLAEILHPIHRRQSLPVKRMEYRYRSSKLKVEQTKAVVLAATLKLTHSNPETVQAKMNGFSAHRRATQPPGASMGSMFKNPPGDYSGRLIEAAGLKGARVGGAEISTVHGNFFVNDGTARAIEVYELILLAQSKVAEKYRINLELEIELVGDWSEKPDLVQNNEVE